MQERQPGRRPAHIGCIGVWSHYPTRSPHARHTPVRRSDPAREAPASRSPGARYAPSGRSHPAREALGRRSAAARIPLEKGFRRSRFGREGARFTRRQPTLRNVAPLVGKVWTR